MEKHVTLSLSKDEVSHLTTVRGGWFRNPRAQSPFDSNCEMDTRFWSIDWRDPNNGRGISDTNGSKTMVQICVQTVRICQFCALSQNQRQLCLCNMAYLMDPGCSILDNLDRSRKAWLILSYRTEMQQSTNGVFNAWMTPAWRKASHRVLWLFLFIFKNKRYTLRIGQLGLSR